MAKVTYLDNCGFAVKTDNILLVFDYYRDPAHALTHLLKNNPELPVVFFVSNSHPDHFNKEIFKLGQNHKHMYVLANDVLSFAGNTEVQAVGLSAGDRIEDVMGALTIEAFSATDAGISFLITTADGETIFYGGDLSPRHYDVKDAREAQRMASQFTIATRRIAAAVPEVNLAFKEVDPRLGDDFAAGAAEFVSTVRVDNFIPMHTQGHSAATDFRNYPVPADCATRFHAFAEVGQTLSIKLPAANPA